MILKAKALIELMYCWSFVPTGSDKLVTSIAPCFTDHSIEKLGPYPLASQIFLNEQILQKSKWSLVKIIAEDVKKRSCCFLAI